MAHSPSSGPPSPLRHRMFLPIVVGLCAVLLVASLGLVVLRVVRATPTAALAGATSGSTLTAYAAGAVRHPGVYTLSATARVRDLLAAAGGTSPDADLAQINLAAFVFDGEEVYVMRVGEVLSAITGTPGIKVNINLASATALHAQLGLSSKSASAIVAYRLAHGLFTSVDQLLLVPISNAVYQRIKDLVTV